MDEQRHSKTQLPESRKTGPVFTTTGEPILRVADAQWNRHHEKKLQRLLDRRRESAGNTSTNISARGFQL
jgi:hypothetical protein